MEYILDGYNVIKSSFLKKSETSVPEDARNALYILIAAYKRKHPAFGFTVVFDGHGGSAGDFQNRSAAVVFSGDISADDKIRLIVERKKTPREVVVVSDDREVKASARVLGAAASGVAEFLNHIAPPPPSPAGRKQEKKLNYTEMTAIEKELRGYYEKRNAGRRVQETHPPHKRSAR